MEENYGFIRDPFSIKLLLLYVLRALPGPAEQSTVLSCAYASDNAFNYFDCSICLAELVENGQVLQQEGRYSITADGIRNLQEVHSELPYSVRIRADDACRRATEIMSRERSVLTSHARHLDGTATVSLILRDGAEQILNLELLTGSEEEALKIERTFKAEAEAIFIKLTTLLTE